METLVFNPIDVTGMLRKMRDRGLPQDEPELLIKAGVEQLQTYKRTKDDTCFPTTVQIEDYEVKLRALAKEWNLEKLVPAKTEDQQ